MKAGDLVEAMHARDLMIRIGIIINVINQNGPFSMKVYTVMCEDGTIDTYTGAALKKVNDSFVNEYRICKHYIRYV